MALMTIWNVYAGFGYVRRLHADYVKGIWILDDELHTLQHFAIACMMILLSISMIVSSFSSPSLPWQFIEHLFYNLGCILIVYPHLIAENNREI